MEHIKIGCMHFDSNLHTFLDDRHMPEFEEKQRNRKNYVLNLEDSFFTFLFWPSLSFYLFFARSHLFFYSRINWYVQQWFISHLNIWASFGVCIFIKIIMKNIANCVIDQSRHFSCNEFLHLLLPFIEPKYFFFACSSSGLRDIFFSLSLLPFCVNNIKLIGILIKYWFKQCSCTFFATNKLKYGYY